jgi:transposase-like protein
MPSYTVVEKEYALRLCNEIGVAKASRETGISANSLYKWRAGAEGETAATTAVADEALAEGAVIKEESAIPTHKRYTAEEQENALRLVNEIGVSKASKQTGITINSLRKWREDTQSATTAADVIRIEEDTAEQEAPPSLHNATLDEGSSEELIRLQHENASLKAQMSALKNALRVFTE